jgi:hypothetical protein
LKRILQKILLSSYGYITIALLKSQGKTCMVEETLHGKQLSLRHVCKIGLKRGREANVKYVGKGEEKGKR